MNKIILNDSELKSLKILLEYLSSNEKKHYEESDKNDRAKHIYKHIKIIESILKA